MCPAPASLAKLLPDARWKTKVRLLMISLQLMQQSRALRRLLTLLTLHSLLIMAQVFVTVLTMHDNRFQYFLSLLTIAFFLIRLCFLFSCCKFPFVFYVCQIVSIKVWKHVTKVLINLSVNFG